MGSYAAEDQIPMGQKALAGLSVEHHHLRKVMARSQKMHDQRLRASRVQKARVIAYTMVTVALFIAGAVVWGIDRRDHEHHQVWGIPVFTWLLVGAVIYPLLVFVSFFVWVSTWVLEVALDRVYENVHYVLISLRTGLKCDPHGITHVGPRTGACPLVMECRVISRMTVMV